MVVQVDSLDPSAFLLSQEGDRACGAVSSAALRIYGLYRLGFRVWGSGFRVLACVESLRLIRFTWTPKGCKIMALMAVIMGFGLLSYILLGFR